jgi:hypothetical protein
VSGNCTAPMKRFVSLVLVVLTVTIGSSCRGDTQIVWKNGEPDWGDWNTLLGTSFVWQTRYAVMGGSKRLLPRCAMALVSDREARALQSSLVVDVSQGARVMDPQQRERDSRKIWWLLERIWRAQFP